MVNEYKALCKTVKIETRKARKKYERELVYKSIRNKKILFKYVNDQQNVKSSIKAIKNVEGNVTNTTSEIVDILNKNFQNSFTREGDQVLPEFGSRCGSKYLDFDESAINYSDVVTRLSKLSIEKSCGVDQLSTIILKNCAEGLAMPIKLIFMSSIDKSELPKQWKFANITLIFKSKGSKLEANN
ncbi:uncharacterized protein LOC136074481 [Hydra vulgaris]|uniref:Uncharacterized protein LOC136074481 n=1 Tax=Hydra vulgaris TaxID=6087 RepID=A0ABM4B252_HYDVU